MAKFEDGDYHIIKKKENTQLVQASGVAWDPDSLLGLWKRGFTNVKKEKTNDLLESLRRRKRKSVFTRGNGKKNRSQR